MYRSWKYSFQASIWTFSLLRSVILDRVIHFGENLRDQAKSDSPKKLKSLIRVPYVPHVKAQILSFDMILISSPWRVPSPSYPFRWNFGRSGKGSFSEKAKIVNWGFECSLRESTYSKLQNDPYLISVACSNTELFISGISWAIR